MKQSVRSINEKEIYPLESGNEKVLAFRKQYGLEDKFVFMYSGNIGLYNRWNSMLSFDECIKIHNRTFEEFRYMHEEGKKSVEPQSLYNLTVALRNICIKISRTD